MPHPEFIHMKNFGFLQTQLPTDLFIKLKEECLGDNKLKEMRSGLSGRGIPKHFYIKECFAELKEYVLHCADEYEKKFKYIKTLNFLNKNAPLFVAPPWVNVQKRYEFLPVHNHEGILSYNICIQIPYDSEKESEGNGYASQLQFIYPMINGALNFHKFSLSKEDEGKLIMFPSSFFHVLYPFYTSKNVRLSIAGNILLEVK
tara:strand:- start:77 stop:682 length:606 start_codon:yes stop_codon:yes gene_type:complete